MVAKQLLLCCVMKKICEMLYDDMLYNINQSAAFKKKSGKSIVKLGIWRIEFALLVCGVRMCPIFMQLNYILAMQYVFIQPIEFIIY